SVQGCKQEIDMTIEQLQEENAKLKQAIISIYTNTEEITLNGEDGYYAVKQSVIDDVIDLTED
ncbi:hook protein, partial [Proteus mirabilis]|uniref:hook protein n=1 Tax=Proteus mirabilis TaxID=584 RepID=UPI003EE673D9